MTDTEKKQSWAEILKHPMSNMILGFLLTTIVGTGISNYYSGLQREEKRYIEMLEVNKKAIASLASLNAERLARAEILLIALERGNTENIGQLTKMYRETELRWKTESSPTLMAARQVLPDENYYRFRNYMENEYHDRFLVPIGLCVDQVEKVFETTTSVEEILTSCQARKYLKHAGQCNTAVLDILYEMAKSTIDNHSDGQIKAQKKLHKERVGIACAPVDVSPS